MVLIMEPAQYIKDPVDVHCQTLDAYDSWLLHAESDERDRMLTPDRSSGHQITSEDRRNALRTIPADVHCQTLDAYDSWLLHAESDERDRLHM